MRLWGDVVDRRKVEAFLLRSYKLLEPFTFTKKMIFLEKRLIIMTKAFALFALLPYIALLMYVFFDSWGSLFSLAFRDSIDINRLALILLLPPICVLASILIIRPQIRRMDVSSSSSFNFDLLESVPLLGSIGFILFMIFGPLGRGDERAHRSEFQGLLIFVSMSLLGVALGCYQIYLMRKYCPYLANYVGGEIKRPDEPDA